MMECKLKKCTINYEQFGTGKPLILLHSWPADHRHMVAEFEPIFENQDGWRRIYPDLPGMGRTVAPGWMTNLDQLLAVMHEFIQTVIPGQRYCVGGTSFGGYVAQGLVYQWPEMIDGVLLLVPMVLDRPSRTLPPPVTLVENPELWVGMEPDLADFMQHMAVVQSQTFVEHLSQDYLPAIEVANHEFLSKISQPFRFSFDVRTLPTPFEHPTLILLGRQDTVSGYRDAWEVIESYPRASFVILDRAGHMLSIEQKTMLPQLVVEWLRRVEENKLD